MVEIVAFIGVAGSGKTSAARILEQHYGYQRLSFAKPIKRMLMKGLGMPYEYLHGELKERESPSLNGMSPRRAMQTLGTEWGRDIMGRDFWLNFLIRDMHKCMDDGHTHFVVDDARFKNELDTIRQLHGAIIRMQRTESLEIFPHESEREWMEWHPDSCLINNGSLEDLRSEIKKRLGLFDPDESATDAGC